MDRTKVAKLIRLLSSPNDGEVIAAARALSRIGIHEIAEHVEQPETDKPGGRAAFAALELVRLNLEVERLESQLAQFTNRRCFVCDRPFVAGRADAVTCSARCRTRLYRQRAAEP